MFWRILLVFMVTLAIGLTGCKKEEPKAPELPKAVEEAEAAAEEAEDVDVEAEVDKIEKEIEADMEE